jgi:FMN-dependent NADH-azoreductase
MPNLLHIDSSADLTTSRSRAITNAVAAAWRAHGDDFTVTYRDLHRNPPPHLPHVGLHWAPGTVSGASAAAPGTLQAALLAELLAADAVVIGAPLYNYSLPSPLKAWVDHIHVPGITAPFGNETAPLAGRRAVIVTSRGGIYDPGSANEGRDHAVPVLELILGAEMRMETSVLVTSRTLAETLPGLAGEAGQARAERERALLAASELGSSLAAVAGERQRRLQTK